MTQTVELPLWLFVLILLFAVVTLASHFLFPSVRWFFRRRLERAVARLNERLERPIEPFRLARRYDMIQRLIYDPQVAQAVSDHAASRGIPENVAFEEARRFAREIVPSFSAFTYFSFAIRAARLLSNAIYRVRLGSYDEGLLQVIDRDATVVFVMNHRSNMDYVLVTYLVAKRSALSYAVGEWARVWPLSRLIRAMGAYFIRRRSQTDLYRNVLAAYVRLATLGGVTQAIFPEGGLSLTGALSSPKHGLLKYIIDGNAGSGKDVVFVPVALNYDRVLEDKILTKAARAGERRFRARIGVVMWRMLRQLWLWATGRYHRFGAAAVTFGRPLSLSELPAEEGRDHARSLSAELMYRIGEVVPVLPVPLVSYLLVTRGAMSEAALRQAVTETTARMPLASIHMPSHSHDFAVQSALQQLRRRHMLRISGGVITPEIGQMDLLRFYANSIAHLVPAALEPPQPTDGDDRPERQFNAAGAKENSASAGS
ncbi:MAG: glycerol-3-phosphate acyltransferase [Alphaproteobacteria bacterium MedPE-SWcel]|mgnify:CR=1 FL=1|nr:MAG: glycerol-3-phosphate acyltransferase [Alphaproteobacteria bacterium MedPE-SWcel]